MGDITKKYIGWKRYLAPVYWRMQWARLVCGQSFLNILSTFEIEIEIDEEEEEEEEE